MPFNLYFIIAAFSFGVAAGAQGVWYIQKPSLETLQLTLENVMREGQLAQAAADAKAIEQQQLKERSDHEYKTAIDHLNSNVERLRVVRARSNYVPAAPTGSRDTSGACFDRAELERALQQFDAGVAGLVKEGDAATIGLNVAREWALTNNLTPTH